MSSPSGTDSFRNVTRYLGQDYRFSPVYYRNRDPVNGTSNTLTGDIKPKEQQGHYPIGSFWVNTSANKIWVLVAIASNQARWILFSSSSTVGPLLSLSDNAGTVVFPTSPTSTPPGNIQFVAGAGISIVATPSSNLMTIAALTSGFTWNDVTGTSATMVKENGYAADNVGLVTLTMPTVASSTFGDTIKIAGFGSGGWKIQCVATQSIQFGSQSTSAAGSISSTNQFDQLEIVCSPTTSTWLVRNAVGNLTLA